MSKEQDNDQNVAEYIKNLDTKQKEAFDALKTFDSTAAPWEEDYPIEAGDFAHLAFDSESGPLEGILDQVGAQLAFMASAFEAESHRPQASNVVRGAPAMLENIQALLFAAKRLAATEADAIWHLRRLEANTATPPGTSTKHLLPWNYDESTREIRGYGDHLVCREVDADDGPLIVQLVNDFADLEKRTAPAGQG